MSYGVVEGWEQLPAGYAHRDVAGVAVDGEDRVFLICRGDHPIILYDQKGNFLAPGARASSPTGRTASRSAPTAPSTCTDDGNHTVRQFTPDGKLLMTLGTHEHAVGHGLRRQGPITSATRPAGPFNRPTNWPSGPGATSTSPTATATAASTASRPAASSSSRGAWPGQGPGQFHLPHGIAVAADGRVFVCDRENDRIQIFSPDGEYLSEWTDTQRPTHLVFDGQGRAYVSELWWQHGPDLAAPRAGRGVRAGPRQRLRPGRDAPRPLGRTGRHRPRQLRGAARPGRGLPRNDVYVSEVTWTFAVSRGLAPEGTHTFQKFALKK